MNEKIAKRIEFLTKDCENPSNEKYLQSLAGTYSTNLLMIELYEKQLKSL